MAVAAAACLLIASGSDATPRSPGTIVRIEVPDVAGTRTGVAFAIHVADDGGRRRVYFLTTAELFSTHRGDRARLHLRDGVRELLHTDIFTPPDHTGVAVLRVVDDSHSEPFGVTFEPVRAGQAFVLWGRDAAHDPCIGSGHIGAVTTRRLRADRRMTAGCLAPGAPVSHERGVFAVAGETADGGPAIFLPLSAARRFVLRHVPGLDEAATPPPPHVQLTSRDVAVPAIDVAAGERREGRRRSPAGRSGAIAAGAGPRRASRTSVVPPDAVNGRWP